MNELDSLITQLIKEKGGTKEQYTQLLDSISHHESAGTNDPTIRQQGGGPGRGVYQFEEGKNAGGITAAKRSKQYYDSLGVDAPKWLVNSAKGESLDATTLSKQQQDILFLGNMRMHPKANLAKVMDGSQDVATFWADNHWAGKATDRKKRLESFRGSEKARQHELSVGEAPEGHNVDPEPEFVHTDAPKKSVKKGDVSQLLQGPFSTPPTAEGKAAVDKTVQELKGDKNYGVKEFASDAYQAWVNPKNYGVNDYTSNNEDFDSAYSEARNSGEKEFMYKNKRYNTKYKGTKKQQLEETGILDEQLQGKNVIRDRLHENLYPFGYEYPVDRVLNATVFNTKGDDKKYMDDELSPDNVKPWHKGSVMQTRNDAYNMYMGKPQTFDSYGVSNYKPAQSKDSTATYLSLTSEEAKNDILRKARIAEDKGRWDDNNRVPAEGEGAMGNYTISKGEDEKGKYISYYDKWDLAGAGKKVNKIYKKITGSELNTNIGKPFEIYDRLYYNQEENGGKYTIASETNENAMGGSVGGTTYTDKEANVFGTGGSHEQNPHGGVPIGTGANGKPNTVEEGEVSYNFKSGKFIFSNRINYEK